MWFDNFCLVMVSSPSSALNYWRMKYTKVGPCSHYSAKDHPWLSFLAGT